MSSSKHRGAALEGIVRFIATDSPERALAFGMALLTRTKQLGDFPESGRVVPELEDPAVREIIHGGDRG